MPLTEYSIEGATGPDQVDTSTTGQPSLTTLALDLIAPSLTNPRKHFDSARLDELAASIRATGLHQPILVRPLPGNRALDTFRQRKPGAPLPTHEIVAGERRWRASQLAGLASVPCLVKPLTDEQVLEVQIIENLQRDDLSALEEAEGYQRLIDTLHINAEQVASKIGKSRSYVYARIQLLQLGNEAAEALRSGKVDASRAGLLARIPDTALQVKALKEITRTSWDGSTMSLRAAQKHISETYMLKLGSAVFKITDADLVPDAGSCKACPKRTGANPDLFADVDSADMCTDPKCFQTKVDAHESQLMERARQRGQQVLQGKEAKASMPSQYNRQLEGGWINLDAKPDGDSKSYRQLLKKELDQDGQRPTLLVNPHIKGETLEIMPAEDLAKLLKAKGLDHESKAADKVQTLQAREKAEAEKAKRERAYQTGWRREAAEQIYRRFTVLAADYRCLELVAVCDGNNTISVPLLRHLAAGLARRLNADQTRWVCKLLDMGSVGGTDQLVDRINDPDLQVRLPALLRLLTMAPETEWNGYGYYGDDQDKERLTAIRLNATDAGVDLDAVKREVKAEQDAARKDKAKAKKPATPAAKKVPGKFQAPGPAPKAKSTAKPEAPRYRDPDTDDTWSGRGKKPRWVEAAIERGSKLEDFDLSAKLQPNAATSAAEESETKAPFVPAAMAAWPFPKEPRKARVGT